jgi:hypothetical protein
LQDTEARDPAVLAGIAAVVISQDATKLSKISSDLKAFAELLLQFDCAVLVAVDSAGASVAENTLRSLKIPIAGEKASNGDGIEVTGGSTPVPYARLIAYGSAWDDIANVLSESRPGPAPNFNLLISPRVIFDSLSNEYQLLIRRAFADSTSLLLEPLSQGHSGATLFRVHANLNDTDWPQPYFIKLGTRKKIISEYQAYEMFVNPYIPFHLGPRLDRDRCGLGSASGILVGDFVDGAELLLDRACEGRSTSAIACLFDKTLLAWHRNPVQSEKSIPELIGYMFPERIDATRKSLAISFGSTRDEAELRRLFERERSPVLVGRVHGDLHSGNILVRANDAIVIDFYSQRGDRPILWDIATLEASLLVEGFPSGQSSPEEIAAWVTALTPLYAEPPLGLGAPEAYPGNPHYWFFVAIQQIRRYAREFGTPQQYAAALSLALLVKAQKDASEKREPQASRRAAAYYFAERLLTSTFGD